MESPDTIAQRLNAISNIAQKFLENLHENAVCSDFDLDYINIAGVILPTIKFRTTYNLNPVLPKGDGQMKDE